MCKRPLALFIALCIIAGTVQAQTKDWKQARHSIELTSGFPSLPGGLFPPGSANHSGTMNAEKQGQRLNAIWPANLTLGYSFRFSSHWACAAYMNVQGYVYGRRQYPENGGSYDWNAKPVSASVAYENRGVVFGGSVRYLWLEKNNWRGYTNVGLGIFLNNIGTAASPKVYPLIAPAGFHYVFNKWFLIGELSFGFTGTGILIGVGYAL